MHKIKTKTEDRMYPPITPNIPNPKKRNKKTKRTLEILFMLKRKLALLNSL